MMTRLLRILGVLLMVAILGSALVACSSDDDNGGGDNPPANTDPDTTAMNVERGLGFHGDHPWIAMDGEGRLHMVYRGHSDPGVFYVRRAANGTWGSPIKVPGSEQVNMTEHLFNVPKIAVSSDGVAHIVWGPRSFDHNGFYYARYDGNSFNPGTYRVTNDWVEFLSLAVTPDGTAHIVASQLYYGFPDGGFVDGSREVYYAIPPDATFDSYLYGEVLNIGLEIKEPFLTAHGGDLHFLCRFENIIYMIKPSGAAWETRQIIRSPAGDSAGDLGLFVPDNGRANFVFSVWEAWIPQSVYAMIWDGGLGQTARLSDDGLSFRPQGACVTGNPVTGTALALWSDSDGRMHRSWFQGGGWSGDSFLVQDGAQSHVADENSPAVARSEYRAYTIWSDYNSKEIVELSMAWPDSVAE